MIPPGAHAAPPRWWLALIVALTPILLLPAPRAAAQMTFSLDQTGQAPSSTADKGQKAPATKQPNKTRQPAQSKQPATSAAPAQPAASGGGDVVSEVAAGGPTDVSRAATERPKVTNEEIYAVQQIYALRLKRFELGASGAFTINDPYQGHRALALSLNYWWTNVLAIGANVLWYHFGSDPVHDGNLNFSVQRFSRLGIPLTQWRVGAYLDFTYVPFYGKFAMFNRFIFQWDTYVIGGVGLMRTRPVPVFDPTHREFDYGTRVAFNVGLGARVFLTRYLTAFVEVRDYLFLERYENRSVSITAPEDPSTWLADSPSLVNNVTVQVGLTLFLPTSFEYRQPK